MTSACSKLRRIWQTKYLGSPGPGAAASVPPPAPAPAASKSTPQAPVSIIKKLFNEPNLEALASSFKAASASSSQFRHRHRIYYYTVNRLAEQKRFSTVEEILEMQKKYPNIRDEGFSARLMRLYGVAGMFRHAHNLFDELPHLKCPRTTLSYNALLGAALHANEFQWAVEIFREYPSRLGVQPDAISYNSVIKALGELGLIDEALLMVDEMKDEGLEPNLVTFNTVVDVAYRKFGFLEGEKAWDLMAERIKGLVPDIRSYNAKLNGMVNGGMVLEAVDLFQELRGKGLEPTVFTYNHLIKGFCNEGDLEEAKKWYGKLVDSRDWYPNRTTFDILIDRLCDDGDADLGFDLSKRMLGRALLVDEASLQRVVDMLVKDSKVEEAEELVKLAGMNIYHQYNLVMPSA